MIRFSDPSRFIPALQTLPGMGVTEAMSSIRQSNAAKDRLALERQILEENQRAALVEEEARRQAAIAAEAERQRKAEMEARQENRAEKTHEMTVAEKALAAQRSLRPEEAAAIQQAGSLMAQPGMPWSARAQGSVDELLGAPPTPQPASAAAVPGVPWAARAQGSVDELLGTPSTPSPQQAPPPGMPATASAQAGEYPDVHVREANRLQKLWTDLANANSGRVRTAAQAAAAAAPMAAATFAGKPDEAAKFLSKLYDAQLQTTRPVTPPAGPPMMNDFAKGAELARKMHNEAAAETLEGWKSARGALLTLKEGNYSPTAISHASYQIARLISGPGVLTESDVKSVFGLPSMKSFMDQGVDWIQAKILDNAGNSTMMADLTKALNSYESRARKRALEDYKTLNRFATKMSAEARSGATGVADVLYEELLANERERAERKQAKSAPAAASDHDAELLKDLE